MSYARFAAFAFAAFCSVHTSLEAEEMIPHDQTPARHHIYLTGGWQQPYTGVQRGTEAPGLRKNRLFYGLGYEYHTKRPLNLGIDLSGFQPLTWEEPTVNRRLELYRIDLSFGYSFGLMERLSVRPALAFGMGLFAIPRQAPSLALLTGSRKCGTGAIYRKAFFLPRYS